MNSYFFISSIILFISFYNTTINAQIVSIPDPAFKANLVNNSQINTNGDAEIDYTEATNYKGGINVGSQLITDLTGIEAFVNITSLNCSVNQISSLDVSQNISLTSLNCSDNAINALDVSFNTNLIELFCTNNTISTLDLSNNTALLQLFCGKNQLSNLDLSQNPGLVFLNCADNQLTNIDVSLAIDLAHFNCTDNQISTLDLSNNTNLYDLACSYNQLQILDLSQNTLLEHVSCDYNPLSSLNLTLQSNLMYLYCRYTLIKKLDLSQNTFLTEADFSFSVLMNELNIANGNNTAINYFNVEDCISLNCVQVDDTAYSNTNWTRKDSHTSFGINCTTTTNIEPLKSAQNKITLAPNPVSDILTIQSTSPIQQITVLDNSGRVIKTSADSNIPVDILSNGIYILQVQTEKSIHYQQFIKN